MSELEQIKTKIAITEAELATSKSKLVEAEKVSNQAKVAEYEDQVARNRKLLTQQQEKDNLLMNASLGTVIIA